MPRRARTWDQFPTPLASTLLLTADGSTIQIDGLTKSQAIVFRAEFGRFRIALAEAQDRQPGNDVDQLYILANERIVEIGMDKSAVAPLNYSIRITPHPIIRAQQEGRVRSLKDGEHR